MCIIENGIDFTKFKDSDKYRYETRKKLNIKDNEIVIGVVGRLSEQKDPITMIKAFKEVYEENKNVKMLFVGSGNLEDNIKKFAEDNNILDKVIITGWVDEVEKFIPAFDIAVLPSKWEGFGLVLIEYMACNKPIVASNVGGISNIINDNINGLLVNKSDCKELAKKIVFLINNRQVVKKIIKNNNEYRKQYDIKILADKHIKKIRDLC